MSALLLDTHVWLWYAKGVAEQLRPANVRKLDDARRGDGLIVSAVSVWEIGMHAARGRIQLAVPFRTWIDKALGAPGIRLAPWMRRLPPKARCYRGNRKGIRRSGS